MGTIVFVSRDMENTMAMDDENAILYFVQVCFGKSCTPAGSRAVFRALEAEIEALGLGERVTVVPSSCRDRCNFGPSINVMPGLVRYNRVDAAGARRIAREHLAGGRVVRDLLYCPPIATPTTGKRVFTFDPAAFRPRDDE